MGDRKLCSGFQAVCSLVGGRRFYPRDTRASHVPAHRNLRLVQAQRRISVFFHVVFTALVPTLGGATSVQVLSCLHRGDGRIVVVWVTLRLVFKHRMRLVC